ncbi:MAG: hypothetical protein ACRC3H_17250 [Lachnospiraceae bacterium]
MKKLICIIITFVLFFSLSLSVSAETSSGPVTVTGELYHNQTEYNVTYSSSVCWFVTEKSDKKVWNNADKENVNCYTIINNNKFTGIDVTFDSFTCGEGAADDIKDDLDLFLSGDLGADNMNKEHLEEGCTKKHTYSEPLTADKAWTYGFTGEYTSYLNKTAIKPVYYLNLSFELR